MLIDVTLKITAEMLREAKENEKEELLGHLGTHFDVMDKEFPPAYVKRTGIAFDVSAVAQRDIGISDIDISEVKEDMFVIFYSGYIEKEEYGSRRYFSEHPQLSDELTDALLSRKISVIGVDFGGIRRGKEHTPKDKYCADKGVFVVENLCNLKSLCELNSTFTVHTYPLNFSGITGIPCRVIAEV